MGSSNVNLNTGLNQQNWRQFDGAGDDLFAKKAKAIAQMIYGSGLIGEGKNGGKGHIGLVGDKVIKFNTKGDERSDLKKMSKDSGTYKDMKESCDNLRRELLNMAKYAKLDLGATPEAKKAWDQIRSALGFEDGDSIKKDADLLERTTAAAVLKKIVGAYDASKQEATAKLTKHLWDGHTPTWGKSVASFRVAVREHDKEVSNYISTAAYNLVEETTDKLDDTTAAKKSLNKKFKEEFGKYGENLEKWFRKTCAFLPGLAPSGTKNEAALKEVKARMDKALLPANSIDSEKSIVAILNELTTLAKGENDCYAPQTFGHGGKFESFSDLVESGLTEVNSRFKAMLGDLGKIKFGEDQHYPDLSKNLSNALKELPDEFEEIAEDLQSVTGTFQDAVDKFKNIEKEAAARVVDFADLKAWNAVFKGNVTKAVEDFDSKLNKLIKDHGLSDNDKASRSKALKTLANKDGVNWKDLATSLVELRNATYWSAATVNGKTKAMNYIPDSFGVIAQKDFRLHDTKEEKMREDLEGFKKIVRDYVETKTARTSIFMGVNGEKVAFPLHLLNGTHSNLHLLRDEKGMSAQRKDMFDTAMEFFQRLHDVAIALEVINEEGGC